MKIAVLGAGVAGLSTAYFLKKHFPDLTVYDAAPHYGGLARSFEWNGFMCDLAPHRLYTNDAELLNELGCLTPLREIRRRSQIFIGGKWIGDPVNAIEIMLKFFPKSLGIGLSYIAAKFKKPLPDDHFDALCLNQFGAGLNEFFFKPYSEKLFGIPANQISAAWGRRKLRVGGLKDMIRRNSKLYFRTFHYPESGGYGAICDALHDRVSNNVRLNAKLLSILPNAERSRYRCTFEKDGRTFDETFDALVSSLPVSLLTKMLGQKLQLRFRPAKLLYVLIDKPRVTPNHWFYFADGAHIINRVAEFKNFTPDSAPEDRTVLCCEVTRVEDFSESRVVEELTRLKAFELKDVLDSKVIDLPWAYPIYDLNYETEMASADRFFGGHPHVFRIGRHAQFAHRDVDEIYAEAKKVARETIARLAESSR